MQTDLDKRYQTLMVLWLAMMMNIVMFFVIIQLAAAELPVSTREPFSIITFVLAALGAFLVVISFAVKKKLLERAVDRQDISLVQKAYVIAMAICELSALIGVVGRFVLGNSDYFLMLIIAFIGIALHFPKRDHLKSASFKSPGFGDTGF